MKDRKSNVGFFVNMIAMALSVVLISGVVRGVLYQWYGEGFKDGQMISWLCLGAFLLGVGVTEVLRVVNRRLVR